MYLHTYRYKLTCNHASFMLCKYVAYVTDICNQLAIIIMEMELICCSAYDRIPPTYILYIYSPLYTCTWFECILTILHVLCHSSVTVVAELLRVDIFLIQSCVHSHDSFKPYSQIKTGVCCLVFPAKSAATEST